ncbi:hypothetical protein AALO_G00184030 [Alosa alosa]|uniref:Uncharacterized protein n=1 Tax=Alosa alosa TaxID=278164 RepID=A0AAV6GE57_9TELE|nr:uncharacterized protein zgc:174888 [Alosa sapidissima]XP_048117111.1 uncharacterized protein zgc:174888 [Alosa alosa]KAG5271791.1 hypothetical protein AALO_G00184030 [Alosa alosa]
MSPTVLLLLSTLIVRVYGCQDPDPIESEVRSLLKDIKANQPTEFRHVFPTNYYVSHRYNTSLLCNDKPCCVYPAAFLLCDSWSRLLKHLHEENYRYKFIDHLIKVLKKITEGKIQEMPDLSIFPLVPSSPDELLSFTAAVLSRWEELECPSSVSGCMFPTAAPDQEDEEEEDMVVLKGNEGNAGSRPLHDLEREGERGRRWSITAAPTNVGAALFHFPGHVLWSLFLLWIALDL